MILVLPLFYAAYLVFWFCVVGAAIVIYVSFVVMTFVLTAAVMTIRAVFRSQWPRDPRRPSIRNRRKPGFDALGRPNQAR